ncbi:MAG: RHS repeat-associated core domain-containing protein [bacterium]|nr:RHS repeat-associated core domain-containing protein [bacterium]
MTTEAFGNAVAQWGSTSNPYRFAGAWGYRDDGDAGLLHVGARYYDPQVGRFLSRDAVLSEHPYLYCEHEPVNRVDPSGHRPFKDYWDWFWGTAGGAAGGFIGGAIGGELGLSGGCAGVGAGVLIGGSIGAGIGAVVGLVIGDLVWDAGEWIWDQMKQAPVAPPSPSQSAGGGYYMFAPTKPVLVY